MRELLLFNTLTRKKEVFIPIESGKVRMYCCGPTVYNYQHIGNLRTFFFEDILRRVLEINGYAVTHVLNITDVGHLISDEDEGDDKMELGAKRENKSVWEIAEYYTNVFTKDLERMHILPATHNPKATSYIHQQIAMVRCLEELGYTYVTGDGVYFDTSKFTGYGKLARLDIEGLEAGERVEFSVEKKNKTDFALWKFSPKDSQRQMEWESPWGKGFPGWHIECSAMSKALLGNNFDIHCGGVDHIPVHHTNEIAQSEACNREKFVNYWLHGEFLLETDGKMSKSKGEFLTLQYLMDKGFHPMHYRYFLMNTHYRKKLNFSFEALDGARTSFERLKNRILTLKDNEKERKVDNSNIEKYLSSFFSKINDDLNVTEALALLWEMLKDNALNPVEKIEIAFEMDKVFGFGLKDIEHEDEVLDVPDEVMQIAGQRMEAKNQQDYKKADDLRNQLSAMGWKVIDTKDGFKLEKL
ncbi:cysteine--tRNA ligase [Ignavibacteria bacterium CHB1]|nr:MAG: cysteine--tRNA ligase [Chlorobiota bacterium]MBV6399311.1 Cysteine--tRNA ligase [Ignavibacteria bacterium]MCC6886755.1 cysteine--tRNA ligase [Ignavibacteriales bacterium]MCE7953692.1 cysteine--tRNA ligase [Chlorobi bacterium CHB7]MDL1887628.1 cysteine--tRNA ligase [Ignavibacteria bacterium CHB1]RIK48135.1 MAG: cysteine--tRNA ligase [Ignavibacteriota bacterium]